MTLQLGFAVRPQTAASTAFAVGEVSGALKPTATVGAAEPRKIDAKNSTSSADNRTPPLRETTERARPAFAGRSLGRSVVVPSFDRSASTKLHPFIFLAAGPSPQRGPRLLGIFSPILFRASSRASRFIS